MARAVRTPAQAAADMARPDPPPAPPQEPEVPPMSKAEEVRRRMEEENPKALFFDGMDDAIIGVAKRKLSEPLVAYSFEACIKIFMDRDGMDYDDAVEFFDFNIADAWLGEGTPVFID